MKTEMNAFDVCAMVKEMQCLVGGHVDKVFHWDRRSVLFRINAPAGRRELLFKDGRWLHMPQERPETPETPNNFAVHLRKMLGNARVIAVEQREFDRIVVMRFSTREGPYEVMFEIFGEGNVIVVTEGKIVNCLEQKTWRHRDVRIGAEYLFPPSRFDPQKADLASFREALSTSTADVVRTLATAANLGGQYAEETCLISEIDKKRKITSITEEEQEKLFRSMVGLLQKVTTQPEPMVYYDGDYAVGASPVPLLQDQKLEMESFPTLSDALDEYINARAPEVEEQRDAELERLLRQLEQQQESIDRSGMESRSLSERANLLYAHYADVVKLLAVLKGKAEEMTWVQLEEFVSDLPFFVSLDPQHDIIVVKIAGLDVELNYLVSLEENANLLFSQAKELREKVKGAESALIETEKKVEDRRKHGEELRKSARVKSKPTKQFWFESYRWFITSNGRTVLGGRDARSNEKVVKKHITGTDRYAHADVHGAASIIIKDGANATDEEMLEACIFALASSKAWTAGVGEGSAYWVVPDQVSKTPVAGEFVPKGGFIIRGKRNYQHHLPLRLGLGEITHEGSRKIMCAPEETIRKMSQRFVIIEPGDMDRGKASSQLSKVFEVPEEEVGRILPPGNVRIVEKQGVDLA